jgi:P4 family phage/plasmid primase-like protien
MHQVLGLRPYFDEKKQRTDYTDNTFFKRDWRFTSIKELFKNPDKILKDIPPADRWNLFYTIAFCTEKKRDFREQSVLMFDIDGIDVDKLKEYIPVVCAALHLEQSETGVVFSGNGLHFAVGLLNPIVDVLYFEKNRRHYAAICQKIKLALEKASLPGKPDDAVFDHRRIMRLPGTENRKENKPVRVCRVLQGEIIDVAFDLATLSGLPVVAADEQIAAQVFQKKYPTPDTDAIIDGCNFLKWCKEEPNNVSEAQWYGMLSILPRLPPNGRSLAHDFSREHRGYSFDETESKIDQALQASGPRTCKSINNLWGKCATCPNFEKVNSPIMIQGESYIKTRDSGFYQISFDSNGIPKVGKPCFEDLRRFFELSNPYIVLGESGICLRWTGKHWEEITDLELQAFAQDHFNPPAITDLTREFKNLICRTNLRKTSWFVETTARKINFSNGVLDIDTLEFGPHSQSRGFRYVLPYDYDPTAKAPAFEKFMHEIMGGKTELIDMLLEYSGYAFSNDECWLQKALVMTGDGANGKSTFMGVLKALAGKENYSALTLKDISSEVSRRMLDGCLFNLAEETPSHAFMDSSLFKNIISGGEITVKQLYKQTYSIDNRAKLLFACNDLPKTKDTSKGFIRRLVIVPFNQSFEGTARDPFIKEKLLKELPGIFNAVIQAYRRLIGRRELLNNEITNTEIQNYTLELDSVKAWFQDQVEVLPHENETSVAGLSRLYAAYRIHAESRGEDPEVYNTMAKRLRRLLPEYELRYLRRTEAGKKEVYFKGVKFADGNSF